MAAVEPVAEAGGEGAAGLLAFGLGVFFWVLATGWNQTLGAALRSIAVEIDRVRLPHFVGGGHVLGPVASAFYTADRAVHQALVAVANENFHAGRWFFNASARSWTDLATTLAHVAVSVERAYAHFEEVVLPRWVGHALAHTGAFATWLLHEAERYTRIKHDATQRTLHRQAVHTTAITDTLSDRLTRGRTREGRLEHDLEALKAQTGRIAALVSLAGFSAFMWRWMGRYGLRWLRCPALARAGARIGCGGFALLEELLAASFLALATSDICRIAGGVTALAEWFRPLLMELVDVEDQLIGCHGATKPDPLKLPRLYLPPVPDPLPLS